MGRMTLAIAGVLVALVVAACGSGGGANEYPPEARANFMAACEATGGTTGTCHGTLGHGDAVVGFGHPGGTDAVCAWCWAMVEDGRAEFGSIAATFTEGDGIVYLFLGADANAENAEFEAETDDAVYLGDGILEGWLLAPAPQDLTVLDGCYVEAGITPPDRSVPFAGSAPEGSPDGQFDSVCDYVLGDFTESASGYRFIAEAALHNTGNVGIVVRVSAKWRQLGTAPIQEQKTVEVNVGKSKTVRFTIVASSDQIDLHQSAGAKCSVNARIIDTFGSAQ